MKIGILGLGNMGIQLATYFAMKGYVVCGFNYRDIDKKKEKISKALSLKKRRNNDEGDETIDERLFLNDDLEQVLSCDLIVDALVEDLEVKAKYYKRICSNCVDVPLMGTLTSTLNLNELQAVYENGHVFALHFFNPPDKMRLIEVCFLPGFPVEARSKIFTFIDSLGDKIPIEVPAIQGFIVNRLLFSYINHAIQFHIANNIEPKVIDKVMRLGTNSPMGPLQLSDYIGNDITLQILHELYVATGEDRYRPVAEFENMVANNLLGKKTRKGFY